MYKKEYFFRYSDIDCCEKIKISTIIDILQDISILHSANAGYPRDTLVSMSIAWLLLGWRIKFISPIDKNLPIEVSTGIMSVQKFEAQRKYEIHQNGECKVIATAVWFTVNLKEMKIIRPPEEIYMSYENITEPDNRLVFTRLRPKKLKNSIGSFNVERRDIDTNKHMNNVRSVEAALDFLPESVDIKELWVTYRRSLHANENIGVFAEQSDKKYFIELVNSAGESGVLLKIIL